MLRRSKQPSVKNPKEIPKERTLPAVLDVCSICLETPELKTVSMLDSCEHYYCYMCIMEWSKSSNTCPLCKKRFHSVTKPKGEETPKKRKRSDSDSSPNKRARESSDVTVVPDRDLRDTQPGPGVILFNNLFAIGSTLNLDLARIRQLILNNLAPPRPAPQYREVNGVIDLTDEIEIESDDEPDAHFHVDHGIHHHRPIPFSMDDDDDSDDADSDEEHIHQIAQRIQNNNNGGPITIDLSDLPDDEPNIPVVRPVQNGEVIELLD